MIYKTIAQALRDKAEGVGAFKDVPVLPKQIKSQPYRPKHKKPTGLRRKLDDIFSLFIRTRDCNNNGVGKCISCGTLIKITGCDNGHYIDRGNSLTRFDEVNCNAQCKRCNSYMEGNKIQYRKGLILKYGQKAVDELELKVNGFRKYEQFEYTALIEYYQNEIKKLNNETNQ